MPQLLLDELVLHDHRERLVFEDFRVRRCQRQVQACCGRDRSGPCVSIDDLAMPAGERVDLAEAGNAFGTSRIDAIDVDRAHFHLAAIAGFRKLALAAGDAHRGAGFKFSVAVIVGRIERLLVPADAILGHPVGDGLIYAVAERLAEFESGSVKVGRFGGDEFMVYFDRVEDETDFANQFNVIFSALQGEVDIAGHLLRIQASGGAVVVPVRDGDLDMITVKADLALYNAKEQGKNCWRLFEADMDAAFRSRQIMKSELRSAIQSRNLRVVYQPIVDVRTMRISDCEALCRWDHPDLGPVSPAIFIPLAEEMGLISEISAFVLEAACQECMNWPQHIGVSVNLSAKDFQSGAVIDKVRETLNKSGIAPERLEIEVTETALLYDKDATRLYIEGLKELGIRIALDDFGTGYSSLSYLHTLPLDRVKIDSSFLHDVTKNPRSHKLLKSVVQLSRGLGLDVTVEGVETFQQLKLLETSVKPDRVQGFLFGSALSASGIKTMSDVVWYAEDGNIRRNKSLQH